VSTPVGAGQPSLRTLALPIYGSTFLVAAGLGAALPITPLFAKELGAGVGLAGVAVAMRGLGTMALDVPAGLLVARFGDRRVMTWGACATAAVAAVTAAVVSAPQLLLLLFAVGAALGLWAMARLHFMVEQVPTELRGRALALVGGTGRLGLFVGPSAGGLLAEHQGLEAAFLLQGAATAAGALLLAVGFRGHRNAGEKRSASAGAERTRRPEPGLSELLRTHAASLAGSGAVAVVLQILRTARHLLIPLWGDAIGLSVAEIGLVLGLSSGLDMLLFYPAGQLMDRRGRRATGVPSLALLSLGLALLPLSSSFGSLLAVGLLLGLGNGLSSGFVMTLGADLSPAEGRSRFLGLWRLLGDAGSAAGPMIVGAVAAAASLPGAAAATAITGAAGALLLLFFVGETRGRTGH
jgi:MFS family permease